MANIVGQYLTNDVREDLSEILKKVNRAFSFGNVSDRSFLLTPDQVFYGSGKDAWKDTMDGKDHHLGPLGYDNPRPGHDGEPGFYQGITGASDNASKLLFNPASISTKQTYQSIHQRACAHFQGWGTGYGDWTLFHGSKAGQFRSAAPTSCRTGYDSLFIGHPAFPKISADWKKLSALQKYNGYWGNWVKSGDEIARNAAILGIQWDYHNLSTQDQIILRKKHNFSLDGPLEKPHIEFITINELKSKLDALEKETQKRWLNEYGEMIKAKIDELNDHIQKRSHALGRKDILLASVSDTGKGLKISYKCPDRLISAVVHRIFILFRQGIAKATSETEIRQLTANLYQLLEWVHGFPDGQGRTDLIMLKTLLTAHGLTPAFLDDPYVSTWCNLKVWDAYLAQGMEKWKQECTKKLEQSQEVVTIYTV